MDWAWLGDGLRLAEEDQPADRYGFAGECDTAHLRRASGSSLSLCGLAVHPVDSIEDIWWGCGSCGRILVAASVRGDIAHDWEYLGEPPGAWTDGVL